MATTDLTPAEIATLSARLWPVKPGNVIYVNEREAKFLRNEGFYVQDKRQQRELEMYEIPEGAFGVGEAWNQ